MTRLRFLVWLIPIAMLAVALGSMPWGYYTLLRLIVCTSCLYLAYRSYKNEHAPWIWIMGATAVLYNPLFPFGLGRVVWAPVNLLTIAMLGAHWWMCGRTPATPWSKETRKIN
ncbi:MAG: DUF6804 family protein [Hyphomonadaceae bacterium]